MKLKELGEDRITAWIKEFVGKPRDVKVGVGDDAAVIKMGEKYMAIGTDMVQEGSHIYKGMSRFQAGRKAAVVNFSDLASMGAQPRGFLLSLNINREEDFAGFKEIFHGAESACQEAGARFLGGDMNKGEKLILDGVAFGTLEAKEIMRRTGARPGDVVAMTGHLGSAACGWQVLEKGLDLGRFDENARERIERNIVKACLEPRARVKEGRAMARSGWVTSCTDISDGLAFSLGYMRDGYGFEIFEEKLPVRGEFDLVCDEFNLDKDLLKYHIGEDFELLCTIKPTRFGRLKEKVPGLKEIGVVTEGSRIRLRRPDGSSRTLKPSGYDHFS